MKTFAPFCLVAVILLGIQIYSQVVGDYQLERDYLNDWSLADKSSTITAKQQHISKLVKTLEAGYSRGHFSSHAAVFLNTQNNSFEANLEALKTLEGRLLDIQQMNPSSFEYNTAIQQITGQEMGEAHKMIEVFESCYFLASHPSAWNWIGGTLICICIVLVAFGLFSLNKENNFF